MSINEAKQKERKLTDKQRRFAEKVVELGSLSNAYRSAYNTGNMSNGAIQVEAHKLAQNPNVALTIESLRKKAAEKHDITLERITQMLLEDREMARRLDQTSAAVSASMGLAKLHGHVIDKKNFTGNVDHRHTHKSEDVSETVSFLAGAIGAGSGRKVSEPVH